MHQLMMTSVLIIALSPGDGLQNQAVADWRDRLAREAPKAWEKYISRARGLQGNWLFTSRSVTAKKELDKEQCEVKRRGDCFLFLFQAEGLEELRAINPKYQFKLRRRLGSDRWALAGLGQRLFKPGAIDDPRGQARLIGRLPITFSAVVMSLDVTVLDPGFSIKQVTPVVEGGRQLVKVVFEHSVPRKDPGRMALRGGSVILDPDSYWIIQRFKVRQQVGNEAVTDEASFEYQDAGDGYPILKKIINRRKNPARKVDVEFAWLFDLKEQEASEEEFRLSAYGISEPKGFGWERGGSLWYLWFIAVAVLCLVVGAFFWRRIQRRRLANA